MICRSKTGHIFLLFLAFLSLSLSGKAQDITHIPDADTIKAEDKITAIPQANIGTETEATLQKMREIADALQPSVSELVIDSLIDQKMEIFERLKQETDLEKIPEMNPLEIENLKNNLLPMRQLFNSWRNTFMDNTSELNLLKKELGDIKTAWQKTLDQNLGDELPVILIDRIKLNLDQINDLENELIKRNNELLTKEDKLTVVLVYIDDVLSAVNKTTDSFRSKIFSISSPPLWNIFKSADEGLKEEISMIYKSHLNDLRLFGGSYKAEIYYHLFFTVFLVFISYYIKNEVAKWSDEKKDENVNYSLYIISKPISSSLIVALSATGLFYPLAPSDVTSYFYMLLTVPLLFVVPGLIHNIKRKYFYIAGVIFIYSEFADYFNELPFIDRINMMILDGAIIFLLVKTLRSRVKIREANPKVKWAFTFTLIKLAVFLLLIAVLSNLLGGVVLAKVLTRGSLTMIFGGGILYCCYIILKGIFALILQYGKVSQLNMVQLYEDDIKRIVFRIIKWLTTFYWLYLTLSGFIIYNPIYSWFEALLSNEWKIGSIIISLGSILAFFLTLWISLLFSKFVRFLLKDEILTHFELPRGVPGAISMMVRLVLIGIGFILAFGAAKIDMDNIAIVFGALGVGIGFGLQNIFNNLVSGLILAFERPIQIGDVIEINNTNLKGEVKDIGIRASVVRTFDGAEVIVPNGSLISNEMINWTLSDQHRRQEIIVGVAYESDMQLVLEILNEKVKENGNVLKTPSPLIIFIGFGDSSLNFRVLFWTHFDKGLSTKSEIGIAINDAFKKAGVEIPFPQRDLNLKSISEDIICEGMIKSTNVAPRKSVKEAKKENRK